MPDETIDTTAPHIGSPLGGLGPETIKQIALQSRQLTPKESSYINDAFKGSINPSDIRIAYDAGASGTNLRGYVLASDLPTVMFLPTDLSKQELPSDVIHEATHVWQNLTSNKYTGPGVASKSKSTTRPEKYNYDKNDLDKPFTQFGLEQQPEMMAANEKSAREFVQSHKTGRTFMGDTAFLDSVRSRYETPEAVRFAEDPAKFHATVDKNAFSTLERIGNTIEFKRGQILKPKLSSGNHNMVLENLRTKHPEYRGVDDGKLLAALLHNHPSYVQHVGDTGLRMALEAGHKPQQ